jgi:glycine/D-amino acid oxidase-like deaminating enzyme
MALRHEFGAAPWLHLGGCLEWGEPPGALSDAVTADSHVLYPAEVGRIEPWLQLPGSIGQVSFFPFEGYADVPLLVGRLGLGLREAGVTIRDSAEVAELVVSDGTVRGVVTTSGQRLEADVVVSCAGPWTDKICQLAGVDLPLAPTQGMLTITRPSPVRLNTLISTPTIHVRDDGSGRVIIGSYEFEAQVAPGQDTIPFPEPAYGMYEAAARLLPGLHGTGIEAVRIGQRAIPADGYPVAGYAPGVQGLYVICTHGGIRLGPLLGRLAAREIVTGTRDERLTPFTPDRLTPALGNGGGRPSRSAPSPPPG